MQLNSNLHKEVIKFFFMEKFMFKIICINYINDSSSFMFENILFDYNFIF